MNRLEHYNYIWLINWLLNRKIVWLIYNLLVDGFFSLLTEIDEEKDIVVTMHANLKPSVHCNQSAQKENRIFSLIYKAFHYRDKVTFINLYKLYVRPHLEFSVPAWCPWSVGDKETLWFIVQWKTNRTQFKIPWKSKTPIWFIWNLLNYSWC